MMRHTALILWVFTSAALLLSAISSPTWAVTPPPRGDAGYDDAAENVFLDEELTFVEVTMDPSDLQNLLDYPWQETYKVCSVWITNSVIDEIVDNVGIRVRGHTSRTATKKSWKLSFNAFVPGREFHGLRKMNLNGEHNDVSIIRSKLAFDLYRDMNVPSPRAHHVHLKINDGTDVEGVQIHVEQIDEKLVDAWFGSDTGYLYKCLYIGERADLRYVSPGTGATYRDLGGGQTYVEKLHDDADYEDLAAFIDFINHSDDATFATQLVDRFSVDNFLRAMAIDVAMGHWDNYWFGANNYYLYHRLDTDRFEYVPHDVDNTYGVDFLGKDWATRPYFGWGDGGYGSSGGDLPPLIARILGVPAYEEQLRRYLLEVAGGPFTLAATEAKIDAIKTLIGPYAYEGSYDDGNMDWGYTTAMFHESYTEPPYYRDWGWGWDYGLKPFIQDRVDYLAGHVGAPPALPALLVNELLASNDSINTDEMGEFEDWAELSNIGAAALDAGGFYLTDDPAAPRKWRVPDGTTLQPGDHLVVWCDEEPADGPLHAGFRLNVEGEIVAVFSDSAGGSVLIDHVIFPELAPDISYGRFPDGDDDWIYMATPTPGAANVAGGNVPPVIDDTAHDPLSPSADEPVTVTSRVRDFDGTIVAASLHYDAGSGFATLPMYDDGAHGDGGPADRVYGGEIPGQTSGATVSYYVGAEDDAGGETTDPRSAPTETYHYVVEYVPPPLFVNEFLALNDTTNTDEHGEYDDWVEIFNGGNEDIYLGGMGLSDNPMSPDRFVFPAMNLGPGDFVLVWCDNNPEQGPLHAGFKLSASGEAIGLYAPAACGHAPIDSLTFGVQTADVSYGREPDGGSTWRFYEAPTPGGPNDGATDVPLSQGATGRLVLVPNPICIHSGTASVTFHLLRSARTTLTVYDVTGRACRTLIDAPLDAGPHVFQWNGRDTSGRPLGAGVYFLLLEGGGTRAGRRFVLLR